MPGGGLRAGRGHRPAADGGQRDRRLDRQHAGQRGGGQLADAVPGDDDVRPDVRRGGDRTRAGAPSSRATKRLIATTSGWVTAVSLIASASPVVPRRQEIGAGDGAGPPEEGFRTGEFQPVGEHSGFLRALSGGEDGQHLFTVPVMTGRPGVASGTKAHR